MSNILQGASRANLMTAIEENFFGLICAYRNWPRAEVHEESGIKWSMTDIPSPLFNNIMGARLAPDQLEATIQSIVTKARTRQVPVRWWTGPVTRPADLGETLERFGFVSEGPIPGMAVDMDNLKVDLPSPLNLTVEPVTSKAKMKKWSKVCATGFGMTGSEAQAFQEVMQHADPETVKPYIGWQNDQAVGTSLLILSAGVAGIYFVTTLPEARGQGIGASLTLTPLRAARALKYKVSILQATKMSVNIYRSLGFLEYCKIVPYLWSPDNQVGLEPL